MFEVQKLNQKLSNEEFETLELGLKLLVNDYSNFVVSLTSDSVIKEKIEQITNDMVCYVVEYSDTIPRNLLGTEKPFKLGQLPFSGVSFIRESVSEESDPNLVHLKQGIAILGFKCRLGIFCHEMNHAFSKALGYKNMEGEVYKEGLCLYVIENDKFRRLTGNMMDEGVTDAISAYYYNTHRDFFKKVFGSDSPYSENSAYDSMRDACEVLLGKDLSNQLLINAYYGDKNAMKTFEEQFDSVMKDEGVHFAEILKTGFDYKDCIDGVNFSDPQLKYYFSKYQLNMCKTEKERRETWAWLKEKGVTEDFISSFAGGGIINE